MKAVLCKSLEGPSALELADIPAGEPAGGEIAFEVKAVSLNFFDTLLCRGRYQHRPPMPFSPGGEAAGIITKLGNGVEGFAVGDRILAYMGLNGCREGAIADASRVFKLPDALAFDIAATLPITFGTALHGLADRGQLEADETVLILGATGGAGLAAVEVSQLLGARVLAAGTSDQKLKECLRLGASSTINLATTNLKERVSELTDGKGVDVVYDCIGGAHSEQALRSIAWGGRFLVIGFASGEIPRIPLNLVLLKECDMAGVFFGRHATENKALFRTQISQIIDWCAEGRLNPHIDQVFALQDTAAALRKIEGRQIKGKVVVRV